MYRVRLYFRDSKELEAAVEEAVKMFDRPGAVVRLELYGEAEARPRQIAARFSKALHVDVVDRTSRGIQRAVAPRGAAFEEIWRLMTHTPSTY